MSMMDEELYEVKKKTINIGRANLIGMLFLAFLIFFFGGLFYLVWKRIPGSLFDLDEIIYNSDNTSIRFLISILVFILGIAAHELIHGVVFAWYAEKGFKSVKFGIMKKWITPYCQCREALKFKPYVLALMMPTLILGILPFLLSLITGNEGLLLFGILLTSLGIGDLLIWNLIRKEKQVDFVKDHPSEAGCFIYRERN